ncbi:MAG: Cyclic di-GMP phosphodiesterase response regulator RpfG [Planctomycetota bacterium]|jgi:putative two-component system response regulator
MPGVLERFGEQHGKQRMRLEQILSDQRNAYQESGPLVCWRQSDRTARILIADADSFEAARMRSQLSSAGYRCFLEVSDCRSALRRMREETPDVVLLDANLPGHGSLDILRVAGLDSALQHIPILFLSTDSDGQVRRQALELGASDFLRKPLEDEELFPRVRNAIVVRRHYQREVNEALRQEKHNHQLEVTRRQLILCLARAAEHRDQHTGNHVIRVGRYAAIIARHMEYPEQHLELLEEAAQLHDVGKIGIPDSILFKPDRLAADEYELIKKHCTLGRQIIDPSGNRDSAPHPGGLTGESDLDAANSSFLLHLAAVIAHSHHERWDGTGYPLGLSGTDIPLEGRIVAVADVFDALSSRRPYKEPYSREACLEIILQGRGTQFDPQVVDTFVKCQDEISEVQLKLMDHEELFGEAGRTDAAASSENQRSQ